jgi:[acyl-carrier-protein] S-malonyltransferase
MALAFIFPGQGSQSIGMLATYPENTTIIQETFAEASAILDTDLWALCQQGPESKLNQTEYTQPVLLVAGVALWRLWSSVSRPLPQYLAGHSLGEYTALVCAQALSFVDAVRLVHLRGQYMQEAVSEGAGAMAAIIGLTDAQVDLLCQEAQAFGIVVPANFNSPGQIVIAGERVAVQKVEDAAKAAGARMVVKLPVSVPSHSPLMASAAVRLAESLESISLQTPTIPMINNVAVAIESEPEIIKQALINQLTSPVRWVETVEKMLILGVSQIVECGPGKVLCGLGKRINSSTEYTSLSQYTDYIHFKTQR